MPACGARTRIGDAAESTEALGAAASVSATLPTGAAGTLAGANGPAIDSGAPGAGSSGTATGWADTGAVAPILVIPGVSSASAAGSGVAAVALKLSARVAIPVGADGGRVRGSRAQQDPAGRDEQAQPEGETDGATTDTFHGLARDLGQLTQHRSQAPHPGNQANTLPRGQGCGRTVWSGKMCEWSTS